MKEFRQNLCLIRRLKESFLNWKALANKKLQKDNVSTEKVVKIKIINEQRDGKKNK
ncbi:16808_t:CDS:2 [Rhizophagus irregularis]|nr:16808_t:CDS:2 [Rhizophagus irregularis]